MTPTDKPEKRAKGFCMVAGTVTTGLDLPELRAMLTKNRIDAQISRGELKVKDQATIYFRPGFDHEYVLVGDAREQTLLMTGIERLSEVLQLNQIPHAYEIYDIDNNPVGEFDFQP